MSCTCVVVQHHVPCSVAIEIGTTFVHDPYSFAAYITLKDEPQYNLSRRPSLVDSDVSEHSGSWDCSTLGCTSPSCTPAPSDHNETSSEDGNAVAPAEGKGRRRVRYVRGPCGHKNSKRLRFKNGQGQYICLECNMKWRSTLDGEGEPL